MDWRPIPESFRKIYLNEKYTRGNYFIVVVCVAITAYLAYLGFSGGFNTFHLIGIAIALLIAIFTAWHMSDRTRVIHQMKTDPDSVVYCLAPITKYHSTQLLINDEHASDSDTQVWVYLEGKERKFDVSAVFYKEFLKHDNVIVVRNLRKGPREDCIIDGSYI